jgi:hypothetical protein
MRRHHISLGWALSFLIGFAATPKAAARLDGCTAFEDQTVTFYNGGSGAYAGYFDDEVLTDADAWDTSVVEITEVFSYGTSDQINAANADYGATNFAGVAIYSSDNCVEQYGEARLNEYYLAAESTAGKKHTACHEVGHLLGLAHANDDGCMTTTGLASPKPYPATEDLALLDVIYCSGCTKIALQADDGHWVSAEDGGGGPIVVDKTTVDVWETFRMMDLGGGYVALQTFNHLFVTAEDGGGGDVNGNRSEVLSWETFELIDLGGGYVAFQTTDGYYLSAENGGGGALVATASSIGANETFYLSYQ